MDPRGFSGFRSGKTTYKRSACEGLRLGSHKPKIPRGPRVDTHPRRFAVVADAQWILMYSHFAVVSHWQTSNNIATYLANQVNNQRFFNNHQMTLYHSDCEDTSDTVCQQQFWWGLDSPGRSYVSSTCRCFSVISLGIKQACKNKPAGNFYRCLVYIYYLFPVWKQKKGSCFIASCGSL